MGNIERFRIYGDNIVECERFFSLVLSSLEDEHIRVDGPQHSLVASQYEVLFKDLVLEFTFVPGFKRWSSDILALIKKNGGVLREAADIILTKLSKNSESPILAIEFCAALPAGNQAWQRNGRALSFSMASIPFLYVTDIGGIELGSNRARRATRLPNPAVPFSYISYSELNKSITLPVYLPNPGASDTTLNDFSNIFATKELNLLIRSVLLGQSLTTIKSNLENKTLEFVKLLSKNKKTTDTLSAKQWTFLYEVIKDDKRILNFIVRNTPMTWKKTAYIEGLTSTAKSLMELASRTSLGLTSTKLPFCVIPANQRKKFLHHISSIYKNLPNSFLDWLNKDKNLIICWIMGFKPKGDDARPDRGLVPLIRMIVGNEEEVLTVIYGPAKTQTWPLFLSNPEELIQKNGLWEAILCLSDAVLIDSKTDRNVTQKGYLKSHWMGKTNLSDTYLFENEIQLIKIGEQDIDTTIHFLFSKYLSNNTFEGMCNPPGGDWSGISILAPLKDVEYRWQSLPRVSGVATKRPDHVFQIFQEKDKPIVLSIESKESPSALEKNIGPCLTKYVKNLFKMPASIVKDCSSAQWYQCKTTIDINNYNYVSAVAFLDDPSIDTESIQKRTKCDMLFSVKFARGGSSAEISIETYTQAGKKLKSILKSQLVKNSFVIIT